jgi:hypothetical protein
MLHSCQYLCSELVTVTYEDRPGQIRQTVANLEEISAQSALVLFEEEPILGAPISLTPQDSLSAKGRDLFGVIRGRLHDAALGWYAIVAFDGAWSRDWFSPKHLLAICDCSSKGWSCSEVPTLERTRKAEEIMPVNFVLSEA